MGEVSIIGLDLAKNVFQAHGASSDGSVVFRRKLSRALPVAVRDLARLLLDQIAGLAEKIGGLDAELRKPVTTDDTARRLTTIRGMGAVTAAAITTFAPPMQTLSKGRDSGLYSGFANHTTEETRLWPKPNIPRIPAFL